MKFAFIRQHVEQYPVRLMNGSHITVAELSERSGSQRRARQGVNEEIARGAAGSDDTALFG